MQDVSFVFDVREVILLLVEHHDEGMRQDSFNASSASESNERERTNYLLADHHNVSKNHDAPPLVIYFYLIYHFTLCSQFACRLLHLVFSNQLLCYFFSSGKYYCAQRIWADYSRPEDVLCFKIRVSSILYGRHF